MKQITNQGIPKDEEKVLSHDFDRFAGLWSKEEAADFDKVLHAQRMIDEEVYWAKTIF